MGLCHKRDRDVIDGLGADLMAANFSPAHHDVALNVEIRHRLTKVRTLQKTLNGFLDIRTARCREIAANMPLWPRR
jgi:hypothetical protein